MRQHVQLLTIQLVERRLLPTLPCVCLLCMYACAGATLGTSSRKAKKKHATKTCDFNTNGMEWMNEQANDCMSVIHAVSKKALLMCACVRMYDCVLL